MLSPTSGPHPSPLVSLFSQLTLSRATQNQAGAFGTNALMLSGGPVMFAASGLRSG